MRCVHRSLMFAIALSALASSAAAQDTPTRLFTSVEYPFQHKRYMFSREEPGSVAHVAGATAGETVPLVVFLHGMNADRDVHLWMGSGPGNLRDHVDAWVRKGEITPVILAAPTHTRYALAANVMWPDFDLAQFIDATEHALGGRAHVDHSRIVVVGHSGAGCNPSGGILSDEVIHGSIRPSAVVAIDTCIDDDVLPRYDALAHSTRFLFYWQPAWSRQVDALARICETPAAACSVEEVSGLHGNPHNTVLPVALERALGTLLPRPSSPSP